MSKKKKSTTNFSSKIVISTIVAVNVFTALVLYLSFLGAMVPDSLINCFFIFWGTEVLGLAGIKICKVRTRDYESAVNEVADQGNEEIIEQIKNLIL